MTGIKIGVVAACLLLAACAPRATRVQPVNGELKDEGNNVSSWCAATSPGYRVFIVGTGSSQTMSVNADPTCRRAVNGWRANLAHVR